MNPPQPARKLRRQISVRPLSDEILEIKAEARHPADAVLLADSVAHEYVEYVHRATSEEADTAAAMLKKRAADLDARVKELEREVTEATDAASRSRPGTNAAGGLQQASLIERLRSEQANLARELATTTEELADSELQAELSHRGTKVLEAATKPNHPARPQLLVNMGVGTFAGIVVGCLVVLVLEQGDRRLRSRDAIAAAADAPVLASLGATTSRQDGAYSAVLDTWAPSIVEKVGIERAFTMLGVAEDDPPISVAVVTLAGDGAAAKSVLQLAICAAAMNVRTAFIAASRHPTLAPLQALCTERGEDGRPVRPGLSVHDAVTGVRRSDLADVELIILLLVADAGPLIVPTLGRRTLCALAVSSGFATGDALASTAARCLDAGHPVRGVIVVNPEPGDETTGRHESDRGPESGPSGHQTATGRESFRSSLTRRPRSSPLGYGEPVSPRPPSRSHVDGNRSSSVVRPLREPRWFSSPSTRSKPPPASMTEASTEPLYGGSNG